MSAVSGFLSSLVQSNAASDAADQQADAASQASQLQYQLGMAGLDQSQLMYQQARNDFLPYMQAGQSGLSWLSGQTYPMLTQTAGPLPSETNPAPNNTQTSNITTPEAPAGTAYTNPLPYGDTGEGMYGNVADKSKGSGTQGSTTSPLANATSPTTRSDGFSPTTKPGSVATSPTGGNIVITDPGTVQYINDRGYGGTSLGAIGQINSQLSPYAQDIYQYKTPTLPNSNMTINPITGEYVQAGTSYGDLSQGGSTLASAPTLYQDLNYQFSTDDPVYQQKLTEKNAEIDKFLAKQGLAGSSAGEAFRQKQINALLAEEDTRQYNRAVSARDYATQTALSQYGLDSDRANTLYNRLYGQQTDTYNRNLASTLTQDELERARLAQNYNTAANLYGLQYGAALDLAKIGAGAAGSAGSASITTGTNAANTYSNLGSGLAQNALYAGNAAAQGSLASGQAYGAALQNIGNSAANVASMFYNPNSSSNANGGYGSYYGSGYGGWSSGSYSPSFYGSSSWGGGGYSPDTYMG